MNREKGQEKHGKYSGRIMPMSIAMSVTIIRERKKSTKEPCLGDERPSPQVSEDEIKYARTLPSHSQGDEPDYPKGRIDLTAARGKQRVK